MGSSDSDDALVGLGPNERALLGRLPSRSLRRFAAALMRTKMRLQFTGWLQYVLPLILATLLVAIAGVTQLAGLSRVATVLAVGVAGLVAAALFDLTRVRRSCRSFQTRLVSDEDRQALLGSVRQHLEAPTLGPTPIRLEYITGRVRVWPVVNATEFLVAIVTLPYDRRSVIDSIPSMSRSSAPARWDIAPSTCRTYSETTRRSWRCPSGTTFERHSDLIERTKRSA